MVESIPTVACNDINTAVEEEKAAEKVIMPRTMQEHFLFGQALKEEGNLLFKQKDYVNAIKKYSKVRAYLRPVLPASGGDAENASFVNMINQKPGDSGEDRLSAQETKLAVQVMAQSFLNMSLCYFMTEDFKKSADRASESLKLQKSVKAYYRRAKAKAAFKDFWGAVADLKEAIKMEPGDPNDFAKEMN